MPDQQSALSEWKRNLKEEIPELQNLGSFLVTKANVHEERKFKFLKTLEAPALSLPEVAGAWGLGRRWDPEPAQVGPLQARLAEPLKSV